MARLNNKDVIETLRLEMDMIADGGYGRSFRTPCEGTSAVQGAHPAGRFDPFHAF